VKRSVKEQWINDLRSGNFRQGNNVLHAIKREDDGTETHSFCCLGVLTEAAVAAGVCERIESPSKPGYAFYGPADTPETPYPQRQAYYLPTVVKVWAGMETYGSSDPHVEINGKTQQLSLHNDEGATFEQIAQAIEDQVPVTDEQS
jgi:hypothetical protein